ncbi:hypothetical protein RA307_28385 [Xanthobacteraceae bacterium Astr-EGSB]|uniref:hypothetical protein n=1 Tax=Astrobacterium formosum TaxID=3069710 RepID=UPI0027B4F7AA|nr:hypothetical protein [Xanthobacteraceae bacterium Astr-EGSB]
MSTGRLLLAALASCCFVAAIGPAHAQAALETAPGSAVVIKRGLTGPVTVDKPDRGGAVVQTSEGTPPQISLVYMAPSGATDIVDTVRYQVGGAQQPPIEIRVRPLAPTLTSPEIYQASFKALFVLFIMAVLLESGLALLFRWRPFLEYFDSRSTNALVAFAFALFFVRTFNLDITTSLVNIYSDSKYGIDWAGSVVTAMIIAGGSAGVNRIFQSFGFRPTSVQENPVKPEPPADRAWIAVSILRNKAVGDVTVKVKKAVVGTITGSSPRGPLQRLFLRDKGRFPQSGGYVVVPGTGFEVEVEARDAAGNVLPSRPWGPYDIAPRAIIDLEFKV